MRIQLEVDIKLGTLSPENGLDLRMFGSQNMALHRVFEALVNNFSFGQRTPRSLGSKAAPQCVAAVIQGLQPSLVHAPVG